MFFGMSRAVGVKWMCNIVKRGSYVEKKGNNTKMVVLDMGNLIIRAE